MKADCSNVLDIELVESLEKKMPESIVTEDLAGLFKAFSDTTRVRILWALAESELCVGDISYLLGMSQSAISHQLRLLKQAHLVKNRREGKVIYYSLDDDHVESILHQGFDHVKEEK